jgi:hypothetical protein
MKNLIVLYHKGDYDVGGLVRFLIKIFDDEHYKNILLNQFDMKVITSNDIESNLKKSDEEFIKHLNNSEDFENSIVFGIHPHGLSMVYKLNRNIKTKKNIKSIAWLNDPHWLAYNIEGRIDSVQKHRKKYKPPFLGNIDYLVTPSSIYFDNLEIEDYSEKIVDIFYFLNPKDFSIFKNMSYKDRLNKIILSGSTTEGYTSRIDFNNLRKGSKQFSELIYKLEHPGYKDNKHMTEMNYYRKLCEFKGAFVGHYDFPINFLLAKHIEVLMCGCLAFFEPNELLESQLGLKEFVHYIPCYKDGKLINDSDFYKNWIESEEGEKIAQIGQDYVMENFGEKQISKLFSFFRNC